MRRGGLRVQRGCLTQFLDGFGQLALLAEDEPEQVVCLCVTGVGLEGRVKRLGSSLQVSSGEFPTRLIKQFLGVWIGRRRGSLG